MNVVKLKFPAVRSHSFRYNFLKTQRNVENVEQNVIKGEGEKELFSKRSCNV